MRIYYYILLLFFGVIETHGQSVLDSLKRVLKDCKSDSVKIVILNKIGEECGVEEIPEFAYPSLKLINKRLKNLSEKNHSYYFYLRSKAEAVNNIGCFFMEKDQHDSALIQFNEALRIQKIIKDNEAVATCLNNIGLLYSNMGENDLSLKYHLNALSIRLKIKDTAGIAMSYNNLATACFNQGKITRALNYYRDALKLYERTGEQLGIATTLNNIALIYNKLGDVEQSLEYFHRSLRIVETIGDKNRSAVSLCNIGYIYQLQGEFDKAEEYYTSSVKIHLEIKSKSGLAQSLNSMGDLMEAKGKPDEAIKYFKEALAISYQISDRAGIAVCLKSIGNYQREKGDIDSAIANCLKSLSLFEEVGDVEGMSISASYAGEAYFANNKLALAEKYGNLSLKCARAVGFPEKIYYACDLLRQVFKKKGEYKKAMLMYETCVKMKDSLLNDENRRAGIKKQFQYNYEKEAVKDSLTNLARMNEEKIKHEQAITQQRTYTYGGFAGLVLMLVVAGVSFKAFKNKQKANIIITEQKLITENQKHIIEEKQKEIIDSINYARKIQRAHLPSEKYIFRKMSELKNRT